MTRVVLAAATRQTHRAASARIVTTDIAERENIERISHLIAGSQDSFAADGTRPCVRAEAVGVAAGR